MAVEPLRQHSESVELGPSPESWPKPTGRKRFSSRGRALPITVAPSALSLQTSEKHLTSMRAWKGYTLTFAPTPLFLFQGLVRILCLLATVSTCSPVCLVGWITYMVSIGHTAASYRHPYQLGFLCGLNLFYLVYPSLLPKSAVDCRPSTEATYLTPTISGIYMVHLCWLMECRLLTLALLSHNVSNSLLCFLPFPSTTCRAVNTSAGIFKGIPIHTHTAAFRYLTDEQPGTTLNQCPPLAFLPAESAPTLKVPVCPQGPCNGEVWVISASFPYGCSCA